MYNTPATHMASAIVGKVTGQTVLDYLKPRLFEPLGIEHPVWDANFQGISLALTVADVGEADRLYNALAKDGHVHMPLSKTFFSPRFGVAADRFGLTWMIYVAP